jgi:hypothetical protein
MAAAHRTNHAYLRIRNTKSRTHSASKGPHIARGESDEHCVTIPQMLEFMRIEVRVLLASAMVADAYFWMLGLYTLD